MRTSNKRPGHIFTKQFCQSLQPNTPNIPCPPPNQSSINDPKLEPYLNILPKNVVQRLNTKQIAQRQKLIAQTKAKQNKLKQQDDLSMQYKQKFSSELDLTQQFIKSQKTYKMLKDHLIRSSAQHQRQTNQLMNILKQQQTGIKQIKDKNVILKDQITRLKNILTQLKTDLQQQQHQNRKLIKQFKSISGTQHHELPRLFTNSYHLQQQIYPQQQISQFTNIPQPIPNEQPQSIVNHKYQKNIFKIHKFSQH